MNPDDCFKKLKTKSIFIGKHFDNLLSNAKWVHNYGFNNFLIPEALWKLESILKKIDQKFPIECCIVLHIPPNTMYNWHNDTERGLSINMKLCNNTNSHTLFGIATDSYSDEIIELNYEEDHFYLFNTQHKHCVINFDKDRYMFSVIFKEKLALEYTTVYEWCDQHGMF